jgi:hypothetical protein
LAATVRVLARAQAVAGLVVRMEQERMAPTERAATSGRARAVALLTAQPEQPHSPRGLAAAVMVDRRKTARLVGPVE